MRRGRLVEYGPADEVYDTPREPYTQQLLAAVPALDPELAAPAPRRPAHTGSRVAPGATPHSGRCNVSHPDDHRLIP
ncbi:hypothetical protein LT493_07840 [Streptomyces tricolor]|nr:hypothetical protein [Streptomyces tricolor]